MKSLDRDARYAPFIKKVRRSSDCACWPAPPSRLIRATGYVAINRAAYWNAKYPR